MEPGLDRYISRSLKNWTAKYHPPVDGRVRLIRKVSLPLYKLDPHPFSEQVAKFLNRYSMVNDQFYYPRQWQMTGPLSHSLIISFHLAANQRLAN
jgi:hypothetical protein